MIHFKNYMLSKIDNKFRSHYTLIDQSRNAYRNKYRYVYTIIPEFNAINNQAELFAEVIVGMGIFTGRFFNFATNTKQARNLIYRAYVYSYIKTLHYAYCKVLSKPSSNFPINGNCYVFEGHKYLYDIIVNGTYYNTTMMKSNTIIEISEDDAPNILEAIEKHPEYDEWHSSVTNRIFNYELEAVLDYLAKDPKCIERMSVVQLDSQHVKHTNIVSIPLGNLCLSMDFSTINYVESKEMSTDKISYFWNKANNVAILLETEVDVNDRIYDTVPIDRYDVVGIGDEVESITGFNPYRMENETKFKDSNPSHGSNPGPTTGSSPKQTGSPRISNRQNPSSTDNASAKNEGNLFKITKPFIKFVKDNKDTILTKENLDNFISIISVNFNGKLTRKQKNDYIGLTIREAFKRYGISDQILNKDNLDGMYLFKGHSKGGNKFIPLLPGPGLQEV